MASESIGNSAQSQSSGAAVEVVVDNQPLLASAAPPSSSKLGLSSAELRDRAKFVDGKRLLHSDSGYISPTVAPPSNGNSPQSPSRGLQCSLSVKLQTGTVAGVSEEKDSIANELNHKSEIMQTVLTRGGSSREGQTGYRQRRRSLPTESPMEEHRFIQDDLILRAYECRESNAGAWMACLHPYCVFIRQMSQHYNAFRNSHNHTCEKCSNFAEMLNKHIANCSNVHCPVQMCSSSRHQHPSLTAQFRFVSQRSVDEETDSCTPSSRFRPPDLFNTGRSSSFTSSESNDMTSLSSMLSSRGVAPVISSLARANLRAKAEEIVSRLDKEEPLLSESMSSSSSMLSQQIPLPHSLTSNLGSMSLSGDSAPFQAQSGAPGQIMLSPIAEQPGTEDISPSYVVPPLSHHGSQPQFLSFGSGYSSYEMDGPGHTSMSAATAPPQSLKLAEEQHVVFPKQTMLHPLKADHLTPGPDTFYYKIRDYNMNEADLLGSGGFGSCMCAQDNTTNKMFAIKQNKNESYSSIRDECFVLSRLPEHDHIIQFLGAVLDERDLPTQPPLICKMMMELAENGNLAEMLKDEEGFEAPLPDDQSLYYLQQILEGVNFLHQSGFVHLDIKAQNVLVFDGGRTVKLTDFGTAIAVGEATAALKGWTPYFVAPEIVKGEVPHFSADVWSALCILIEMLTAKWPGCYHVMRHDVAMMYLIGSYEDVMINDLVPLNKLDVEPAVKQLFIDVFKKDPASRPTAMDLLQRPVIISAVDYGRYFDDCYDSEGVEELDSVPPQTADFSPINNCIHEVSSSSHPSLHSMGDVVPELPQFIEKTSRDRGSSQDSGVMDLEGSVNSAIFGAQLSMRSSSSGSGGQQARLLHQDSGLDDMNTHDSPQTERPVCIPVYHMDFRQADYRPRSSSLSKSSAYPTLTFSSLPQVPSVPPHDNNMVQRSFSFGGRPAKRCESSSRTQSRAMGGLGHTAKRQRPNSIHPKLHLKHSQSAPAIGLDPWRKRRHSLQHIDSCGTGEAWETETGIDGINPRGKAKSHLRRTSSEVYVDQGPDIDTPEKEKNARLQEFLNQGSFHAPPPSAQFPVQTVARQTSDAGIQCDSQSATSSLSSTSTSSSEPSDSKKPADDKGNDRDDDHPPSNGSQAFQIC